MHDRITALSLSRLWSIKKKLSATTIIRTSLWVVTAHLIYEPHALRRSDDPSILGNVVLMSLINEHSDLGHQFFTKRQNELYSVPNVSSLKVQLMHQPCFLIKKQFTKPTPLRKHVYCGCRLFQCWLKYESSRQHFGFWCKIKWITSVYGVDCNTQMYKLG